MHDTSKLARARKIKNTWVTNGYLSEQPLLDLCLYLDAASINLKAFNEKVHRRLVGAKLRPVMDTLVTLKKQGVWFEVINLIVPTYTDDLEEIKRMCGWLVETLGPDYPLHFLRFRPMYQLTNLPPTPVKILGDAREAARKAGLNYVYLGNVPEFDDAGTTYCPQCRKAVIEREFMTVTRSQMEGGKCRFCGAKLAGVWGA
jgi:pyruvate formate lyase activating enzyme